MPHTHKIVYTFTKDVGWADGGEVRDKKNLIEHNLCFVKLRIGLAL